MKVLCSLINLKANYNDPNNHMQNKILSKIFDLQIGCKRVVSLLNNSLTSGGRITKKFLRCMFLGFLNSGANTSTNIWEKIHFTIISHLHLCLWFQVHSKVLDCTYSKNPVKWLRDCRYGLKHYKINKFMNILHDF